MGGRSVATDPQPITAAESPLGTEQSILGRAYLFQPGGAMAISGIRPTLGEVRNIRNVCNLELEIALRIDILLRIGSATSRVIRNGFSTRCGACGACCAIPGG